MSAVEVLAAPAGTTLQDGGRRGHARHGVPRSGPVDVLAHRLAARLAGVAVPDLTATVAIEVGPRPAALRPTGGAVALAVAGAGAVIEVGEVAVPAPCVVRVPDGLPVSVRARTWAYVVPAGDVRVPPVLGSRSHHPRSGLGPSLAEGTVLPLGPQRPVRTGLRSEPAIGAGPLAILAAPQTDHFDRDSLAALTGAAFHTTAEFDRMGYRLDGPALRAPGGHDIVSDGIVPGAVQVPGDGRATVLAADHQTTGGYPKIAVLGAVALARLVRLPPGHEVRFAWSDVATVRAALRAAHAAIEDCVAGPVRPSAHDLRDANLVTGVTDGSS